MCHSKILPHQLRSHIIEGSGDEYWILSGSHREVLKPAMEKLSHGDGPRVVPLLKVYPSFGRGASSVQ